MTLNQRLSRLHACAEAREWAKGYPDLPSAWAACPRADWMLWLAAKAIGKPGSAAHRQLVLVACACARYALPHVKAGEGRPVAAIEIAERWARREKGVTIEQVRAAAAAAAADAAYAAAAAYAAYAAADAAYDAAYAAAADAAYDAAYAAAADAAYAAAWQRRRDEVLAELADLVRTYYPEPPVFVKAVK
jgi:hypothetical protein